MMVIDDDSRARRCRETICQNDVRVVAIIEPRRTLRRLSPDKSETIRLANTGSEMTTQTTIFREAPRNRQPDHGLIAQSYLRYLWGRSPTTTSMLAGWLARVTSSVTVEPTVSGPSRLNTSCTSRIGSPLQSGQNVADVDPGALAGHPRRP